MMCGSLNGAAKEICTSDSSPVADMPTAAQQDIRLNVLNVDFSSSKLCKLSRTPWTVLTSSSLLDTRLYTLTRHRDICAPGL